MRKFTAILIGAILSIASAALAADRPIRIGVGAAGPISAQAEADIERLVGELPNVTVVPIQPPGGVDACVKRFVAGDPDDRLDAVMIVSLPTESFKSSRDSNEANFSGSYEIWTLNLSTLAEDRHRFTFNDTEPVVGGAAAFLAMPAQLFAERATGKQLISTSQWQAYEAVQTRVEAKLVAATRIYLATAPIRDTGPLVPLETAKALLDRGDGNTAMAVFKSAGLNNPAVKKMIADAQEEIRRGRADNLLGQALGAIAGGDDAKARTFLADYEREPAASVAVADSIRRALGASQAPVGDSAADGAIRSDTPALTHSAFTAMLTQMYADETGAPPDEVIVEGGVVTIEDKHAPAGLKHQIDSYAAALGRSARLASLKCGCAAAAALTSETAGGALLKASYAPSFKRPQVGLP
ncbi:MAG TPA: hypothetical protein VMT58_04525 [Candidatus Binataceae bacterium]|nr:hypothetical protein [Candidatus Binataceae bacterium]